MQMIWIKILFKKFIFENNENFYQNFKYIHKQIIFFLAKGLIWTFLCLSCVGGGGFLIIKGFINHFENRTYSK